MNAGPPRILEWLAARLLPAVQRDHLLGDLAEEYRARRHKAGRFGVCWWYLSELLAAVRHRSGGRPTTRRPVGRGHDAVREVRQSLRSLLHRPGFTASSVLTLALALGAAAAVFAVVDGILLRPLPYAGADRIVSFSELHPQRFQEIGWSSVPNFLDIGSEATSFEATALFRGRSMSITGGTEAQYVYSALVSDRFFAVFGARPWLGRSFTLEETVPGGPRVAILSYDFWRQSLGADSGVVGTTIAANGVRHEVVGVMGPGFNAPGEWIDPAIRMSVWIPFPFDPAEQGRGNRSYNTVGRLAPGVTLEDARAEMQVVWSRLQAADPQNNGEWKLRLMRWDDLVVGGAWRPIALIGAITALVLLVALANASNLVLNRVVTRRHEYAIRCALGADRWRLARQALTESLLVTMSAAALAAFLAAGLLGLLHAYPPEGVPRLAEVAFDWRAAVALALAGLVSGLAIGIIPAWQAARPDAGGELWRTARLVGTAPGARRLRNGLAVAQLALALSLLIGCLLVLRGFGRLQRVDPGFDPTRVMTATVALSWDRVSVGEDRDRYVQDVLEALRGLPGVASAASINSLPFSGSSMQNTLEIPGLLLPDPDEEPYAGIRSISPQYASTMGIPLRGRDFSQADLVRSPLVALVNETMARRYLSGSEPIGRRLILFGSDTVTVVGVIGDVHHFSLESPPVSEVYLPLTGDNLTSKTFVTRAARSVSGLAPAIRQVVAEVDPDQPLRELLPMTDWVGASLAGRRFQALVFGMLAGLAVVLSLVGLVAVVSYGVTDRLPEIGIRMALGASRRTVLRWVLRWSWLLAAPAAGVGVLGALAAGGWLRSLLYEVSPRDLAVFAVSLAGFAVLVTAAALVPALRATRVDPASVLKG